MLAGRAHQRHRVLKDLLARDGGIDNRARSREFRGIQHRAHARERRAIGMMGREDAHLLHGGRVADANLEQEAIELGFRQRIGALLLDRILGREDGEPFAERIADAVDGG